MSRNNARTFGSALREGRARLKAAGKPDYALEAALLLEQAAGLTRAERLLRENEPLPAQADTIYQRLLSERESGRPLQYILGEWEFMGLPFFVGEGVLIPRNDTETLVESILEKQNDCGTLLDIGTGSGCIPVALGKYGTFEKLLAVDISPAALAYAEKNAQRNGVEITFYESDLFSALPKEWKGRLDAVVSNPPYIRREEIPTLMQEVREFEPKNALDGGVDGLDFYRRIIQESREWLRSGGWLFFEIGYDQGKDLLRLMTDGGFAQTEIRKDLAGLDRAVFGRKTETELESNV